MKLIGNFKFGYILNNKLNCKKENKTNPFKEFDEAQYKIYSQAISNQNKSLISFGGDIVSFNEYKKILIILIAN